MVKIQAKAYTVCSREWSFRAAIYCTVALVTGTSTVAGVLSAASTSALAGAVPVMSAVAAVSAIANPPTFQETRSRFRGIDSARLVIDSWPPY